MNDTDKRALVRLAKVLRQASLELGDILERNGGAPPARRKPTSRKPKRKAPPAPALKFWDTPPPSSPPDPTLRFWN